MTEANKQARFARQMEGYMFDVEQGIAPEQQGLRSGRLRGLSRRDQERIADGYVVNVSAMPEWEGRCEPISVGEETKVISNLLADEVEYNLITRF